MMNRNNGTENTVPAEDMSIKEMPANDISEEELETACIQNRLKNLLWTISGDYSLGTEVNAAVFKKSKYIALYDAVCKGGFARYFRPRTLEQYFEKAFLYGAEPSVLLSLSRLCIESAVWKKLAADRGGIAELRRMAFEDTLKKESGRLTHTDWGALEGCYLRYCLYKTPAGKSKQLWVDKIVSLQDAGDTIDIIRCLDEVYNGAYPKGFADEFKGFGLFEENPGRGRQSGSEEDEEDKPEKEEDRIVNLLDDHLQEEDDGKNKAQKPNAVVLEDESMALAKDYIELNYGKSYLTPKEQRQLNYQICTGAHKECKLHFSDGLLSRPDASAEGTSPAEEQPPLQDSADTYQMEYARRVLTENLEILKANQLMTRQNILSLADILKRALLTREEKEIFPDEYGKIRVDRLWNIGRTDNRKMFDREFIQEFTDFAVEILIDSSGSQQIRQSMVALQGYIISEALSLAEIPHRVMGFCTFGDYTVMRRYRDYDEPIEADKRILEFYGSANNRDGLAIRAAAHSLSARREENKILIVLSDGTPNDIIVSKSKSRLRVQYCNDYAVKDTAREVYSLRSKGIAVMGIFAGEEEALPAEKQIFGNEFAYIRKISDFSNVVGRYLKEQLMV
ncbi:hypothetical protein CE91St65_34590 [[Clostridium] symbiosum]|jgi:hypothetical protein|uniref:hypothetical protein n=1 Tax=Clostridium symbiosum TaxID=1512 RepID=UPI0015BC13FA|nr:hypothetical protein [[Clostridium] symbiosum]MBO1696805.1 hypothetical protein [[Clostridium] symbiosum]MDB1973425.1 hypothetical protein [[Clostridium] symbiosum]BDF25579.1 hypothetical protein CE91St65_34590 [[Clostridium] symbiosum]BDF30484.1 hypothetical protein CE91St66_34610 [[Clostridium] symbiosum]